MEGIYPALFFYGCSAHSLHLLSQSIFRRENKVTTTKGKGKKGKKVKVPQVFSDLGDFITSAKEIITFFRTSHVYGQKFDKERKEFKFPRLIQPAPTRWCSVKAAIEALAKVQPFIVPIINEPGFLKDNGEKQKKIRDFILDPDFHGKCKKLVNILEPTNTWIQRLQGRAPIFDVLRRLQK